MSTTKRRQRYRHWSTDELIKLAQQCETRTEFRRQHTAAYQAVLRRALEPKAFAHMPAAGPSLMTRSRAEQIAREVNSMDELKAKNVAAYQFILKNCLQGKCFPSQARQRRARKAQPWSKAQIRAEAASHCTLMQFFQHAPTAYYIARRAGYLKEIAPHLFAA